MATIQWFPGHMSKARRQVQENLKFVDFVTILVDARLPLSSQNPMLTKIVGDKPKLLILNKTDLADPAMTKEWRQYFESQGIQTLVGNKPGVTKGQQWLKTNKDLEILDTPGILWPKFEDETVALKLALTGAIKDQLLPMDEVTIFGLNYFKEHYPEMLAERFKQMKIEEEAPVIIMDMTRALGFRDDYDRFYSLFVKEVRDGKLGNYTLDTLEDLNGDD